MGKIDFIVIGAQKAGTSALDRYLRQHPEIGMPDRKELHFFDNEALFAGATADYFELEKNFSERDGVKVYGESTPIYIFWNPSIKRIWEYDPKIKLVAVLRNPIERAFSHWNMEVNRDAENKDFLYCISHEEERCRAALPLQHRVCSYTARGLYSLQIERVYKYFSKDQVLLLKYENFKIYQRQCLETVFDFLGVDTDRYQFSEHQVHQTTYRRKMSSSEKNYLLDLFSADVGRVEKLLGWDCSDWLM